MKLWIIGITCLSLLGIFFPATAAFPVGPSLGNVAAFRPSKEQHAEFGEGIRDWFRKVKNRIFGGGDQQSLPPIEAGKMMMELENEDLQDRRANPGTFFLDLTSLKFNPETDWGFRLGQWYFIRKPYDTTDPDNWNSTPQSTYPELSSNEDGKEDDLVPPLITIKFDNVVTTGITSVPSVDTPEMTVSTVPERKVEENETRNIVESAEVLLPAE